MSEPDIKQSRAEKINADIGFQKKRFFAKNYDPLNVKEFEDAYSNKIKSTLEDRSSADTMQTLTGNLQFNPSQNTTNLGLTGASDLSKGYQTSLLDAGTKASAFQNQRLSSALGVATGQSADTSKSLALLSNLGASQAVADAKAKQLVNMGIIQGGTAAAGNIINTQADKAAAAGQENWATKLQSFLDIG